MDYVAAGYFLAPRVARPSYVSGLLPDELLSASPCICPTLPDTWALSWTSDSEAARHERAAALGIAKADVARLVEWITRRFDVDVGWPNVLLSFEAAQALRAAFPAAAALVLFGLAFPRGERERLLAALTPADPREGKAGFLLALERDAAPAPGGVALGHEIVCLPELHSWLCNGLETDVAKLGILPNAHGFIDDLQAATRAAEYCGREDVGAEPGLWLPALVSIYP
jgi:hypothetical protein